MQSTSRQSIAAGQRVSSYRPNGQLARHVTEETFFDTRISAEVKGLIAEVTFTKGTLTVGCGEKFYLVASKFEGYYYVVAHQENWTCSASDERVRIRCIAAVQVHIEKRAALLLSNAYAQKEL